MKFPIKEQTIWWNRSWNSATNWMKQWKLCPWNSHIKKIN